MTGKMNSSVSLLAQKLRNDPVAFLQANQHEGLELEYKAGFEYDLALNSCPGVPRKKEFLLNKALGLRILESITAFANTNGGLLVLGVAEQKNRIIDKSLMHRCNQIEDKAGATEIPCVNQKTGNEIKTGSLVICGLDKEFSLSGFDFDQFQRHIHSRFSFSNIKGNRRYLSFKPVDYPCAAKTGRCEIGREIRVWPSEDPDLSISEIFPAYIPDTDSSDRSTIGVIVVNRSDRPTYLKYEETGSQTVKYVFPVRRSGKTDLEQDWPRVHEIIQKRFSSIMLDDKAEEFFRKVFFLVEGRQEKITAANAKEIVNKYAKEWREQGYPYSLVEQYGKEARKFTNDPTPWKDEKSDVVRAFLLMVSLHFNAGWEKWTPLNRKNKIAVQVLLDLFHHNYWRTRFRAMYALQFMDQRLFAKELSDARHQDLPEKTIESIRTHVAGKTALSVIKKSGQGGNTELARKANAVLLEISTLWKDSESGEDVPF